MAAAGRQGSRRSPARWVTDNWYRILRQRHLSGIYHGAVSQYSDVRMSMATEDVDPRFTDLDAWPIASALEAMWDGQMSAVAAVREALPAVTAATVSAAERLKRGGRLVYVVAGTSGRVAVPERAEGRGQLDLDRDHAAARSRPSRHDGQHACRQRQIEAARRGHGDADRRVRRGDRGDRTA